jgi:hypothetical protein
MEFTYRKTLTNCVFREVLLLNHGEEIGHFSIIGLSVDGECFGRSTCSMSIYVNEEFQKKRLSKKNTKSCDIIKGVVWLFHSWK